MAKSRCSIPSPKHRWCCNYHKNLVDLQAKRIKELTAERDKLKKVLTEWLLHHYGLQNEDNVAGESHCCEYCWQLTIRVLDIRPADEYGVKAYLEQALSEQKGGDAPCANTD